MPGKSKPALLRLYVAGSSPNSVRAQANLNRIQEKLLRKELEIEVIDVLREPERALADRVLMTPALLRVRPLPQRLIVGDLSERAEVAAALGLEHA